MIISLSGICIFVKFMFDSISYLRHVVNLCLHGASDQTRKMTWLWKPQCDFRSIHFFAPQDAEHHLQYTEDNCSEKCKFLNVRPTYTLKLKKIDLYSSCARWDCVKQLIPLQGHSEGCSLWWSCSELLSNLSDDETLSYGEMSHTVWGLQCTFLILL